MIHDLKKGLRLLTYSFQFLPGVIGAVILEVMAIFVLGVWIYFCSDSPIETYSSNSIMLASSVMILLLAPLMLVQLGISLECSGIILSSRFRKTIGVHLPDAICIAAAAETIILVTAIVVISGNTLILGELTFLAGIVIFMIFLYMTLAFRYTAVAIITYIIGYVSVISLASFIFSNISENTVMHGGTGMALGILITAAGLTLCALLRRFLYKKPVAKSAVNRTLRKYM